MNSFSKKNINPYNDREEVETKIKASDEISYQFEDEDVIDNSVVDCLIEERSKRMKKLITILS